MDDQYFLQKVQQKIIYVSDIVQLPGNIPVIVVGFRGDTSCIALDDITKSVGDGFNVVKVPAGKKTLVLITKK